MLWQVPWPFSPNSKSSCFNSRNVGFFYYKVWVWLTTKHSVSSSLCWHQDNRCAVQICHFYFHKKKGRRRKKKSLLKSQETLFQAVFCWSVSKHWKTDCRNKPSGQNQGNVFNMSLSWRKIISTNIVELMVPK